jgi:hypothetical protein
MTGFEEFLDDWGLQIINNRVVPAQKKTKVITEEIGHRYFEI